MDSEKLEYVWLLTYGSCCVDTEVVEVYKTKKRAIKSFRKMNFNPLITPINKSSIYIVKPKIKPDEYYDNDNDELWDDIYEGTQKI